MRADAFWCAPFDFTALPEALRRDLGSAAVTILKGDLNYRRLVGDRWWAPVAPFVEVTSYFPGRVAALRALKSDVVVGLTSGVVSGLEALGQEWRTTVTYALIQVR